jgi:succinylarginine dihydrolase
MNSQFEVNFDGLVGPSHHYGGLSFGNRASMMHASQASNPKAAALQGLEKMQTLALKGYAQAVLPPLPRPNLSLLRELGFTGTVEAQLKSCFEHAPELFSAVWSASSMWVANAATVFPSADTKDGRLRFVPANLASQFHRSLEACATRDQLRAIFADTNFFEVTDPLPGHTLLGDEGAANHTRFVGSDGKGLHFLVFGTDRAIGDDALSFPARQTMLASQSVARLGAIGAGAAVFAKQSTEAINAGVFHNDVIAVGHGEVLFCHEQAYADQSAVLDGLRSAFARVSETPLQIVEVPAGRVSLENAVGSYLFNSQLLDRPEGGKLLVVPIECRENEAVAAYLDEMVSDPGCPIRELLVFNLRQSMRNGGGPACLRLRVQMTEEEQRAISGRLFIDRSLFSDLSDWVNRNYRDCLSIADLASEDFYRECAQAFFELSEILEIPELKPRAV